MIKIPSYIDFVVKLIGFLGIDYDEEEKKTDKCRIKELRDFNKQADVYNNIYLVKIIDVLSGGNEDTKQGFKYSLNIIESLMRYLINKNYYTLASEKQVLWGLFILYYIPIFACMLSQYKNTNNIPKYLIDNDFMLPIVESNKIVLPTKRLKRYLKENIKKIEPINDYIIDMFRH